MRFVYFKLAASASLEEIAAFWKSQNQFNGLFNQKRADFTNFERKGIVSDRPKKMDLEVYRQILEIEEEQFAHADILSTHTTRSSPSHA